MADGLEAGSPLCRRGHVGSGHACTASARTRPDAVLGDKAYGSGANRRMLRVRRIRAINPEKSAQIAARKTQGPCWRPTAAFNADDYRDRNVVERSFALVKQWRGIATRYDKLAITYRAGAILHACLTWAVLLGDTP